MSFTPGVTGFFGPRDLLIEPLDPGEFRTLVYTFARPQYGRVLALDEDLSARNFYAAQIAFRSRELCLLLNVYAPYAALAPAPLEEPLRFLDWPEHWPAALPQYRCLSSADLTAPCPPEQALTALSRAERDQVRHWDPQTMGELLFDFWD